MVLITFVIVGLPFFNYFGATLLDAPIAEKGIDLLSKWGIGLLFTIVELVIVTLPALIPFFGGYYYRWLAKALGFRDIKAEKTHEEFMKLLKR